MKDNLFCMNLAASDMQVLITSLSALFDKFVLGLDFAVCTYQPPFSFLLEETIALEMDLETSRKLPRMTLLLKMKTTSSTLTPELVFV